MITVKELISELSDLDGDTVVILQKDGEGNGYSPLSGLQVGKYQAENTWAGEFVGDDEVDEDTDGIEAVVLYPVN